MNNQVGLGILGTFGEPLGYQQVFYFDVGFNNSLDLDDTEIEFYPGEELYAIKRELVEGVYTVCFCMYSSVNELNTDRLGTFLGTCIVLQNSYAEADYIYRSLRTLHQQVMNDSQNVDNNNLKAQQAYDVLVKEPEDFVALKATLIPISKTPFSSTLVDPERKCFVSPDPNTQDSKEAQITAFFEEALKHFTDTGTLYFSFDQNVTDFVRSADFLAINNWEQFTNYKSQGLPPPMVVTKKGIQKFAPTSTKTEPSDEETTTNTNEPEPSHTTNQETAALNEVEDTSTNDTEHKTQAADYNYDKEASNKYSSNENEDNSRKPFNLWEEPVPENGWSPEEADIRQKEYNRLFNYTSSLVEHLEEPEKKKSSKKPIDDEPDYNEANTPEYDDGGYAKRKKRKLLLVIAILVIIIGGTIVYLTFFDNNTATDTVTSSTDSAYTSAADTNRVESDTILQGLTANTDTIEAEIDTPIVVEAAVDEPSPVFRRLDNTAAVLSPQARRILHQKGHENIIPIQPVAKVDPGYDPNATPPPNPSGGTLLPSTTTQPKDTSAFSVIKSITETEIPAFDDTKELFPRPNFEINQSEIIVLSQVGIKNKTLAEITTLLYDKEPTKIGYIYKGQEAQYKGALYNANKQLFQKSGNAYIFTADYMQLRIPAYKSPRLPVSFPK